MKKLIIAVCMLAAITSFGCAPGMAQQNYQLPQNSTNGLIVFSVLHDGDHHDWQITPHIKVEPVIGKDDDFSTRYSKSRATFSNSFATRTGQDSEQVALFAYEWPAGKYAITPEVVIAGGSMTRTYSFAVRQVTILGGKIVYAGSFHYSGLKAGKQDLGSILVGTKLNEGCRVLTQDESARDMGVFRSKITTVSGNEVVMDVRQP